MTVPYLAFLVLVVVLVLVLDPSWSLGKRVEDDDEHDKIARWPPPPKDSSRSLP